MVNGTNIWIIISALFPAVVLLVYMRYCDRKKPEPWFKIILGIILGVGAVFLTHLLLHVFFKPISSTALFDFCFYNRHINSVYRSFYLAAIPEETSKLILLCLLLRFNKDYDEAIDGIVYSVCIGLGFAGYENIIYLLNHESSWVSLSIIRCIFAIPGHYIFAVCMGFYYSLVHIQPTKYKKYIVLIWLVPVLAHGVYDYICVFSNGKASMVTIIYILLMVFSLLMHRFCYFKIRKLQIIDQKLSFKQ